MPAEVRSSASRRSSAATLTNSRSHAGRILIMTKFSCYQNPKKFGPNINLAPTTAKTEPMIISRVSVLTRVPSGYNIRYLRLTRRNFMKCQQAGFSCSAAGETLFMSSIMSLRTIELASPHPLAPASNRAAPTIFATANPDIATRTAPKTSHRPRRTTGSLPPRTSGWQCALHPCQRRSPRSSTSHNRCA